MSLNADAVRRLATLARLDLDPAEQAALRADLNAVLGLIDRLQSVDTQGVAPLTHPQALALRLQKKWAVLFCLTLWPALSVFSVRWEVS